MTMTITAKHVEGGQRLNRSSVTICNDDLLYLVDHCYTVIGDEKLKSICDRLLLSALHS